MSGNNFVTNKEGIKKIRQEKQEVQEKEIVWTSPGTDLKESGDKYSTDNQSLKESKDGFFSFFKKSRNIDSGDNSGFASKKRVLSEYNETLKQEKQNKNFFAKKAAGTVGNDSNKEKHQGVTSDFWGLKSRIDEVGNSSVPRKVTLKTNLIKEDITTYVNWKKNIIFVLTGLIFVVFVIGGFYVQLIYEEYKFDMESKGLDSEIEILNVKINDIEKQNEEIGEFQKKLSITSGLLDNHVYWTNFFKFLEENTLSNSYYTSSISGDVVGVFNFEVITEDYKSIDDQLRVLAGNEYVLEANTSSGAINEEGEKSEKLRDGVSYSLELKLSPDIFKIKH